MVTAKEKLLRFVHLECADKWLLLQAMAWLAMARLLLVFISFRDLSTRLARGRILTEVEVDPVLLLSVGRAVSIAARHVPWRSDCFPQAIAARILLRRHGYPTTIHLGVARASDESLAGHAWITCAGSVVTGAAELYRYTEMYRFET